MLEQNITDLVKTILISPESMRLINARLEMHDMQEKIGGDLDKKLKFQAELIVRHAINIVSLIEIFG